MAGDPCGSDFGPLGPATPAVTLIPPPPPKKTKESLGQLLGYQKLSGAVLRKRSPSWASLEAEASSGHDKESALTGWTRLNKTCFYGTWNDTPGHDLWTRVSGGRQAWVSLGWRCEWANRGWWRWFPRGWRARGSRSQRLWYPPRHTWVSCGRRRAWGSRGRRQACMNCRLLSVEFWSSVTVHTAGRNEEHEDEE